MKGDYIEACTDRDTKIMNTAKPCGENCSVLMYFNDTPQ